jgi:hypothetical protein
VSAGAALAKPSLANWGAKPASATRPGDVYKLGALVPELLGENQTGWIPRTSCASARECSPKHHSELVLASQQRALESGCSPLLGRDQAERWSLHRRLASSGAPKRDTRKTLSDGFARNQ